LDCFDEDLTEDIQGSMEGIKRVDIAKLKIGPVLESIQKL
jgi:hypothetical protein